VTQKVILAETGTAETIDDANVAECGWGKKSKKLNLIREEPLTKREEWNSALPFFIDYYSSATDDIVSFSEPTLSS